MHASDDVDRAFAVTRFPDTSALRATEQAVTFAQLCDAMASPKVYASKQNMPLIKLARFGDKATDKGCLRHDGNVLAVSGVEGDHDAETMTVEEAAHLLQAARIRAQLFTTPSHAEAAPRWRVLAPFSCDLPPAERLKMAARLNGVLGGALAPESFTLSQSFYFGRVDGVPYEALSVYGDAIDLRPDLDDSAAYPAAGSYGGARESDDFTRPIAFRTADASTIDDLRSALSALPSEWRDDRTLWVKVCPALKSLADARPDLADAVRDLWHEFSEDSAKYDEADADETWDTFYPDSITHRSIFKWAKDAGWSNPRDRVASLEDARERAARIGREGDRKVPTQRVMTGTEMLEELVYIADGSRVALVNDPRFTLPLAEFRNYVAGSVDKVKVPDSKRTLTKHRVDVWMAHPERKTVRTQTFAPGKPAVCDSPEGVLAQNLWLPAARSVPDNWQELAQPFFDHVAYLIPVGAERERFLDWIAHIEQAPGVLPSTHYLLVAKQTGIGRNWLAYALARVFAGHTALGFDLGETLRSGFNGALSRTLLAVVDELREGGPTATTRPQAEKLKSLLTEATRRINPKYGRQHVEFNAARFLMFSNHEAALPLTDNDRRVIVIENPSERRPADYYRQLYALLDDPALGDALAEAFKRRDISGFNPGAIAPMNEAKGRTIRAGRSEIEQAVRDVAAEWPSDCITAARLSLEVSGAIGSHVSSTQGAGVAAGLVKYGNRVKVAGVAQHIWLLRNASRWSAALPSEVAAEALEGQARADRAGGPSKSKDEIFNEVDQ